MSHFAPPAEQTPAPSPLPSPQSSSLAASIVAALGAILLIVPEIWLLAAATVWAADGLLGLTFAGDLVLVVAIAPLCIWATWMTVKLAIAAEREQGDPV